ncbi:MAG TPA: gamma-glutamyl-gamma-aminobutyrate hydrolase family protein [Acidimicrobiales bacterium]|nr:gamma-glutamyl-gamma-aminobutyrate hydrolase family protein [Acidimicrobiales bacterium]
MDSNVSEPLTPPLIGISTYVETARYGLWDGQAALVPWSYVDALIRAEGCPVLLPPSPLAPTTVLAVLDGLVLTGGPDVGSHLYGAPPHHETGSPQEERDGWEMALCLGALERDLPLLAICRGLQVLNVSLGGSLHQHLPEVLGNDVHRVAPGQMSPNRVVLRAGSAIASVLGTATEGLCHHHQGVDQLGNGVQAVGFADDGTVEAVQVLGKGFALGVQWHPENDPADNRLFVALVEAALHYRQTRLACSGKHPVTEDHR